MATGRVICLLGVMWSLESDNCQQSHGDLVIGDPGSYGHLSWHLGSQVCVSLEAGAPSRPFHFPLALLSLGPGLRVDRALCP